MRDATWVSHVGDGVANGAVDGLRTRRELQLCAAAGAVDEHQHGWISKLGGGDNEFVI